MRVCSVCDVCSECNVCSILPEALPRKVTHYNYKNATRYNKPKCTKADTGQWCASQMKMKLLSVIQISHKKCKNVRFEEKSVSTGGWINSVYTYLKAIVKATYT